MKTIRILATMLLMASVSCSQDKTGSTPEHAPGNDSSGETRVAGTNAAKPETAGPAARGSSDSLTAFERSLIAPLLEEIRQGVHPFGDQGIGICEGTGKTCKKYLGTDVGELPPGKYMVRAELAVPNIGPRGTWKVRFETECETTTKKGGSTTTSKRSSSKEYDVVYVGPNRGYRLSPLRVIESPATGGSTRCTYKLTALHKDGNNVYTGSWEVPEKD